MSDIGTHAQRHSYSYSRHGIATTNDEVYRQSLDSEVASEDKETLLRRDGGALDYSRKSKLRRSAEFCSQIWQRRRLLLISLGLVLAILVGHSSR